MGKITISALLLSLSLAASAAAAGRPITVNDLLAMDRVSEPQLSADGARAVYSVAVPDLAANRLVRNIWLVTLGTGDTKALTATGRDGGARWSPDGKRIAFISQRDGSSQLYVLDVDGRWHTVRTETPDPALGRRRQHRLVAGWADDCLYVRGVSGLPRRCVQRRAR